MKINYIIGSDYSDNILLFNSDDSRPAEVEGLAGDDYIDSKDYENSYTVRGGDGNDRIFATTLRPSVLSNDPVFVNGNAGDDLIRIFAPHSDSKYLGGQGNDKINVDFTVTYDYDSSGFVVNGNLGDDVIKADYVGGAGGSQSGYIRGGKGNDSITVSYSRFASSSDVVLTGDLGDDQIRFDNISPNASTSVFGGEGVDVLYLPSDGFVKAISVPGGVTFTFAAWEQNGIAYEQNIFAAEFERFFLGGQEFFV